MLHLVERQEGHHTLPVLVHDDLVDAAVNALHRLEEDALAADLRSLAVLLIDLTEAGGLTAWSWTTLISTPAP